jgi:hypothetical protein
MREKIKDYEHWVFIGIGVVVLGVIFYYWRRHQKLKQHKPLLADVALEKVVEKVHEKEHKTHPKTAAPAPGPLRSTSRDTR